VRIWRVIKYWLVLVAIIFALSFVFGIDLPS
jgi:small-conductance mechanosensitive channel